LKTTKSTGPGGFHPLVLNELVQSKKLPLSIILAKSYEKGSLPMTWKEAHITPIHKKGKKVVTGNYRPVSLTS
jgi:hypothetical protein